MLYSENHDPRNDFDPNCILIMLLVLIFVAFGLIGMVIVAN
jgi:hypothetical protein